MFVRVVMLFFVIAHAANAHQLLVRLGNETVAIQIYEHGVGQHFVHLHQNETIALQAAKRVVQSQGGSVMTLVHSGERNIVFSLDGQRYAFDPNRMFTDVGIKKSLTTYGAYSPAAQAEVKKLADKCIALLPKGKIIAVHNNHDYSIKEYFSGKPLAKDAAALHLEAGSFYRNFYLVTQLQDYQRLKQKQWNVVLQAKNVTNDGSLSVFLSKNNYVNIEAGYGQLAEQVRMIKQA